MSLLTLSAPPEIAFAALIAGVLAIYVELARPGRVVFGAAGAVIVMLALYMLPLDARAVALLLAAAALFLLEARFRAHNVLAAAAACALVLGALAMGVHLAVALALGAPFSVVTARRLSLVFMARRNKETRSACPASRDPL